MPDETIQPDLIIEAYGTVTPPPEQSEEPDNTNKEPS
jgi:hypothetical protein